MTPERIPAGISYVPAGKYRLTEMFLEAVLVSQVVIAPVKPERRRPSGVSENSRRIDYKGSIVIVYGAAPSLANLVFVRLYVKKVVSSDL